MLKTLYVFIIIIPIVQISICLAHYQRHRRPYQCHKLHKNDLANAMAPYKTNLFASLATEASKLNHADSKYFDSVVELATTTTRSESTPRSAVYEANSNAEIKALLNKVLVQIANIEKRYNNQNARDNDGQSYGKVKVKKKKVEDLKCTKWGHWTDWSSCSVSCGKGRQIRWRHCVQNCTEAETEMEEKTCQLPACSPAKLFGIIKL